MSFQPSKYGSVARSVEGAKSFLAPRSSSQSIDQPMREGDPYAGVGNVETAAVVAASAAGGVLYFVGKKVADAFSSARRISGELAQLGHEADLARNDEARLSK